VSAQMWNVQNIRQSVYSIERLERPIRTVRLSVDLAVCSTRNDIGQTLNFILATLLFNSKP